MFDAISSVFSFLTIIPTKTQKLEYIAQNIHFFPIVGIGIGLIISFINFVFLLALHSLLASLFVVVLLMIITGLHHLDGLIDFADGIMTKGNNKKKIQSMKDTSIGSAGASILILYIVSMILIISMLNEFIVFKAIILSEMISKFSMILQARLNPAISSSISYPFIKQIKHNNKMIFSTFIVVTISVMFAGITGLLIIVIAFIAVLIIGLMSRINFGGISGDVLGATNELTRLISLFVFVVV